MAVALFFVGHWLASVFTQSFFLHRYGAHRMCTMSKGWERFWHLATLLSQGSSYLDPRAYAIMHRMHHAYSDAAGDPHSPRMEGNLWRLMWETRDRYVELRTHAVEPEARFEGGYPSWPLVDRIGQLWVTRLVFVAAYVGFYATFATAWWQWLFLPWHIVMGPTHGAIVNWGGHRYGYRNYAIPDDSKNMLRIDFITGGELYQNNHHRWPQSPNFAARWFEIDFTWQGMRALAWLGIVQLPERRQVVRWPRWRRRGLPRVAADAGVDERAA
jgi:stearoyl-CoA desaturase (delta-9 desaturase)